MTKQVTAAQVQDILKQVFTDWNITTKHRPKKSPESTSVEDIIVCIPTSKKEALIISQAYNKLNKSWKPTQNIMSEIFPEMEALNDILKELQGNPKPLSEKYPSGFNSEIKAFEDGVALQIFLKAIEDIELFRTRCNEFLALCNKARNHYQTSGYELFEKLSQTPMGENLSHQPNDKTITLTIPSYGAAIKAQKSAIMDLVAEFIGIDANSIRTNFLTHPPIKADLTPFNLKILLPLEHAEKLAAKTPREMEMFMHDFPEKLAAKLHEHQR